MRLPILALSLLLAVPVLTSADVQRTPTPVASNAAPKTPSTNLAPIDLREIPEQCHPVAKQAAATNVVAALSARISLANCLADVKLAPLKLVDCEASMQEVDEAVAPAFALLDEVIAGATDDVTKIVAERAKAELYTQMHTKMLATLPPPGTTQASLAMYAARKSILDLQLTRWQDAAATSWEHILAIVKATPKLEKNPVVALNARTARDRLKLHVATAKPVAPAAPPAQPKQPDERDKIITDEEELR
jgi:hypothetical protein